MMLIRHYSKTGRFCRVTFKLPENEGITAVALCGDFNGWDPHAHPMRPLKQGGFSLTLSLPVKAYQFRYYLNGEKWTNDPDADGLTANPFGDQNSMLDL